MTSAEFMLDWIISHRGEPECEEKLADLAMERDVQNVIDIRYEMWLATGDSDPVTRIEEVRIRKHIQKMRRDRKIMENRKHYAQICAKRGA